MIAHQVESVIEWKDLPHVKTHDLLTEGLHGSMVNLLLMYRRSSEVLPVAVSPTITNFIVDVKWSTRRTVSLQCC